MHVDAPKAEGSLVHELVHAVNLLSHKAQVVHDLGTLLGKVHVVGQGKPLGYGGRGGCVWVWGGG